MRDAILVGVGAALSLLAPAAMAQDGRSESLTLLCQGTEATIVASAGFGYGVGNVAREGRTPASLVVLLEGDKVRVKPPEVAVPVYAKRSKDEWYDVRDASVDKFSIRGRVRLSGIDRPRLSIDRRTGAATFGTFTGVCNRVANATEATRF